MSRIKGGITHAKRARRLRKMAKGYRWGRKNLIKRAHEAVLHAGATAFAHRRKKKGDFRRLWQVQINAAARANGMPYRELIFRFKKHNVALDRKILSLLAREHPETFSQIVKTVSG